MDSSKGQIPPTWLAAFFGVVIIFGMGMGAGFFLEDCQRCSELNETVQEQEETIDRLGDKNTRLENKVSTLLVKKKELNETILELNETVSDMKRQSVWSSNYYFASLVFNRFLDIEAGVHVAITLFGLTGFVGLFAARGLIGGGIVGKVLSAIAGLISLLSALGLLEIIVRALKEGLNLLL